MTRRGFDRGWLRSRVLPSIRERWPSAATTVARSAWHLAEASRLLAGNRAGRRGGYRGRRPAVTRGARAACRGTAR